MPWVIHRKTKIQNNQSVKNAFSLHQKIAHKEENINKQVHADNI